MIPPVELSVLGLLRHMTQMEHIWLTCGGLGRRLVEAVERRLPDSGLTVLIEHAVENERAASAYDGLGFEVAWIDPGDGPAETTVWRRRRIDRASNPA